MPLDVIGAGYSRTGTLSLKLALDQLGFGPCFHMVEFVKPEYAPRRPLWRRVAKGETPDWEAIFAGFSSAVDLPTCIYYRKLSIVYPRAKIILTVRDPSSWYRSAIATIWARPRGQTDTPEVGEIAEEQRATIEREVGFNIAEDPSNEALTTTLFGRYTDQVKRNISPKRLLVFDVKDGWGPLCDFLGVSVPNTPFPWTDSTAEFFDSHATASHQTSSK